MINFNKFFKKNIETISPVENLSPTQKVELSQQLETVIVYLLALVIFAFPLLFVPTQADWFDFPKSTFLLVGSLLVLVLWLARSILAKKLLFANSVFFFPAFALTTFSVVSALISPNRFLSLTTDPVLYFGCFLLLILVSQTITKEKSLSVFINSLLLGGIVLSLLTLAQTAISFVPSLKSLPNLYLLAPTFSPSGSPLSQAIFLALLVPISLATLAQSKQKILPILFSLIICAGLAATLFAVNRQSPVLLPHNVGWRITTATMGESLSSALLGVGPGNFVDTFTANKSLDFNSNRFWNLRFTTSSNFYFYILTTVGIAGLAAFLLLTARLVRLGKKRLESGVIGPLEKGLLISLLLALASFALLPAPAVVIFAFFALLGVLAGHYGLSENSAYVQSPVDLSAQNSWFRPGLLLLSLAALGFAGYYLGSFFLADYYFAQSLNAAQNNRGTDTYNYQIQAATLNPWQDSYRISYSQTNLALADALAGQPNLTDQQKQTIVALVQQAIREGRLAVALAPKRAANWENLSLIYRGLINFAQGADQWAVAAQNQAIILDPANPRLRLDLGGIYFARQDYQSAGQQFANAINLKNDYANAHYNFAQTLKVLKLKDQATEQLQLTASLVCAAGQTADCQRVNSEIAALGAAPQPSVATPSAQIGQPLATASGKTNLPKAKTKPPAKIATPSGELQP